jgi:hypothetical protein
VYDERYLPSGLVFIFFGRLISVVFGCGKEPLPSWLLMFLFAWTFWITHNKMVIEKVFPKSPSDVMYVAVLLMLCYDTIWAKERGGLLTGTSIVPVLTPQVHLRDAHENNQTKIFFFLV